VNDKIPWYVTVLAILYALGWLGMCGLFVYAIVRVAN
jgi:hypothetical protein